MKTKATIISSIIFFVVAIAPSVFAQKSASATMQVQVTVVEGNSITQTHNNNIVLSNTGSESSTSELTTIILNNSSANAFVINRPESLSLTDANGGSLEIPIIYSDTIRGSSLVSKVNAKALESAKYTYGTYKGSITTSVTYF